MKKRTSSVTSTTKIKNEVASNFLKYLEINYNEQKKELKTYGKTLNDYDTKFLKERYCMNKNGRVHGTSSDFFSAIARNLDKDNLPDNNNNSNKNLVIDLTNVQASRNALYSVFSSIEEMQYPTTLILKNVGLLVTIYEDETDYYTPTEIIGALLKLLRLDIITSLDISDNDIGNDFIHSLFIRGIAFTTNLKQIKLSNTGINSVKVALDIISTFGAFELPYYLKSNKMNELINNCIKSEGGNNDNRIFGETRNNSIGHTDDGIKASRKNFSLQEMDIYDNKWTSEAFKILENLPNIIPRITYYKLSGTIQSEKNTYFIDRNNYIQSIIDLLISSCSVRRNSNTRQKKLITLIKKKPTNWAFGYSFFNSIKRDKTHGNYYIHLNFRGREDEFIVVYFKGVNGSKYIEYCQEWLPKLLEQEYNHYVSIYLLYEVVFDKLNKKMKDMAINEGVTILILHICEYKMYVINLGDSLAILKTSDSKIPIRLSRQHVVSNSSESLRLEKRNIITDMFDECHSVTRMIGYSKLSNIITTKPEILVRKIDFENDQYIIISDRDVWSVLSMDDVDQIYNEVIGQMKDETLVSSNWPDVVAKRILYLVKNKYKIKDEISIILLILYKKDMPKCKKKIEDISNISPVTTKDKALSFQNIIGMIGLGKNDKSIDDDQASSEKISLEKINNNSYTESSNKSDFEVPVNPGKRMSLDMEYNPIRMYDNGEGTSSVNYKTRSKISLRASSFKNYEIPLYKNNVSNEFITEMENYIEVNTVNWFKKDSKNYNRFSKIINQFSDSPFKSTSNYELEDLSILDEEKNSTDSNSYRNIFSSNDLQSDIILTDKNPEKKRT